MFHCELNPIEPYRCQAKWHAGGTRVTRLGGYVRRFLLPYIEAVERRNISIGIIEAYQDGLKYCCEGFKDRVYEVPRRIEASTDW